MEEAVVSALSIGVLRIDEARVVADANDWFVDWYGASREDLVGHPLDELLVHSHDDLFPDGRGPGPFMMLHAADPRRAVMVARHGDEHGEMLVLTEASSRFHRLTQLRRRYSLADRTRTRLELIMNSSVAFSAATTEDQLAGLLADTTLRAYRAEQSTVFLHRADGTSEIAGGGMPLGDSFDAAALVELVCTPPQVVKVEGEDEGERLLPGLGRAMRAAGVHAFVGAPLHHEEIDFGAFVSWFRHERTFDDEAAPLAEALAAHAAQALATLRLQERLAHAATHDEVTGLPNRRLLEQQLEELMRTTGCAVLFIDLDGFKDVNDQLGHHAGDRLLRDVGQRLLSGVRAGDVVARYGGDEFVVACPVSDRETATEIAERVLAVLRGDDGHPSPGAVLRASIGVAVAPAGTTALPDQIIRRADVAMYRAKSAGGDRIVVEDDVFPPERG